MAIAIFRHRIEALMANDPKPRLPLHGLYHGLTARRDRFHSLPRRALRLRSDWLRRKWRALDQQNPDGHTD
jgi:hypothetical protein